METDGHEAAVRADPICADASCFADMERSPWRMMCKGNMTDGHCLTPKRGDINSF